MKVAINGSSARNSVRLTANRMPWALALNRESETSGNVAFSSSLIYTKEYSGSGLYPPLSSIFIATIEFMVDNRNISDIVTTLILIVE